MGLRSLWCLLLVSGCSIDAAGLHTDQRLVDAGRPDARAARDGGADAGRSTTPDAGGLDAPDGDAGRPARPDGGADAGSAEPDAGPSPTCDELFGSAADYILCWETDLTCAFNVTNDRASCDEICGDLGFACYEAYDNPNDASHECEMLGVDGCSDTSRGTELCECYRM